MHERSDTETMKQVHCFKKWYYCGDGVMLDIVQHVSSGGLLSWSTSILGWPFWGSGRVAPPVKMSGIDHLLFLGLC